MTPSEELMLEVLAARYRLGEVCWTFGSNHSRTAKRLETAGLVFWKFGIVEKTIRVWLTEDGKKAAMDPAYKRPLSAVKYGGDLSAPQKS